MSDRREAPVRYLDQDPGEIGTVWLEEPSCPECARGLLMRQPVLQGELLTCRRGCGQRYWVDRPR